MREVLRNQKFRRLLAGRVVTNIGDSMYFIATMWLVYSLTGSPFYSGVAGFLTQAPAAFQFLAGPLVDSWDIRRTLIGTQLLQAALISVVPISEALDVLSVEIVLVVMPLSAALNQFVYPAQTTALPRFLDDEELVSANSMFTLSYQGIDMSMNGVSGVLIGVIGAVSLFVIDTVTFLVSALLFATVSIPSAGENVKDEQDEEGSAAATDGGMVSTRLVKYMRELTDGIAFVRGTFIVWLVAGAVIVNLTYGMVLASMPAYANSSVGPALIKGIESAGTYGILMAAFAGGGLIGSIIADSISGRALGPTLFMSYAISGVLWSVAIYVSWLPITALLICLALIPIGLTNVQLLAVMQSAPPEEYVGRVSSLLGSASTIGVPIGSLFGGSLADRFSPRIAMGMMGVFVILFAMYVYVHPQLRRLPAPADISINS